MIRTGEDVAVFVVNVARDEGREEGQEKVPEPVGGGRKCALLGARARWESLANQNPDTPANERGQVSSTIRKETHGAQVVAKPQMNMQAETIITVYVVQSSKYMLLRSIRTIANGLVRLWVLGGSSCGEHKEPC